MHRTRYYGDLKLNPSSLKENKLKYPKWESWLAFILLIVLPGACMEGATDSAAEPSPNQDRPVTLYLYPPTTLKVPAQAVPYAMIESNTDAIISLDPGVTVSGSLLVPSTDEDGDTVVIDGRIEATIPDTNLSYEAQTDQTSHLFELTVPSDRYDILVVPSSEDTAVPPQKFFDVSVSSRNKGELELPTLDPGVPLWVRLSWANNGAPLVGARVYTLDAEYGYLTSVPLSTSETDEGLYGIQAAQGDQILWMGPTSSGTTPLYNTQIAALTLDETAREWDPIEFDYPGTYYQLAGQTQNSVNQPVSDVTVFATRRSKEQEGSFQTQTTTNELGEFQMDLPEGTYDLVFRPPLTEDLSGTSMQGLYVNESADLWLDVIQLSGQVALEVTVHGPDGTPVVGASLTLQSDPNDRSNQGTSAFTGEGGVCELELGVGSYLMEIDPPQDSDYARRVVPLTIAPESEAQTSSVDVTLEVGFSSTITFLVEDTPVVGLILQAWTTPDGDSYEESPASLLATAISDQDGQARLVLPEDPNE